LVMVAMIYFWNCHLLFSILKWWSFQHKVTNFGESTRIMKSYISMAFIFRLFWVCLCHSWWEKCTQHNFLWNSFVVKFSRFSLHWKF
jgi:hypothetical protein